MPDTDAPSRSEPNAQRVNLPAVIVQQPAREPGESWLTRVVRVLFNWKSSSARADLQTVLEHGAFGETGFSPQERVMLTNILALRGRRVDDVMVPRADIIAVQQDIPLGELIKVFEGAGHSRLVVYNDTLDDPVGMAHIRDVIGYMVRHAQRGAGCRQVDRGGESDHARQVAQNRRRYGPGACHDGAGWGRAVRVFCLA